MSSCILRLWPIEVSLSSVPQMIVVGSRSKALTTANLSRRLEVREELREHVERRLRQHLVDELDVALGYVAHRMRTASVATMSATYLLSRRKPSTTLPVRASPRHQAHRDVAAETLGQQRHEEPVRVQPTGGRRDQADPGDPLAEQLRVLLGQGDDRHAAHRVADEDDPALGHHLRR